MKLLKPFESSKVWGYEHWLVSTHRDGQSCAADTGKPLADVIGRQYPLLVKIIRADDSLSVQVHPDDDFARLHENDSGKTECWYILEAKPGAQLISGLVRPFAAGELRTMLSDGTFGQTLRFVPVQKGDLVYIPSGTVHAILGGITLLEVQESSNVTYRLYDWGRQREMHLEKGLQVLKYTAPDPVHQFEGTFSCPYFTLEHFAVSPDIAGSSGSPAVPAVPGKNQKMISGGQQGTALYVMDGTGSLHSEPQTLEVAAGSAVFIESGEHVSVTGAMTCMSIAPEQTPVTE